MVNLLADSVDLSCPANAVAQRDGSGALVPLCSVEDFPVDLVPHPQPTPVRSWLTKQPPSVDTVEDREGDTHMYIKCECGRGPPLRSDDFMTHLKRMHGDELLKRAFQSEKDLQLRVTTAEEALDRELFDEQVAARMHGFNTALVIGKAKEWLTAERKKVKAKRRREAEEREAKDQSHKVARETFYRKLGWDIRDLDSVQTASQDVCNRCARMGPAGSMRLVGGECFDCLN